MANTWDSRIPAKQQNGGARLDNNRHETRQTQQSILNQCKCHISRSWIQKPSSIRKHSYTFYLTTLDKEKYQPHGNDSTWLAFLERTIDKADQINSKMLPSFSYFKEFSQTRFGVFTIFLESDTILTNFVKG